MQLPSQWEGVWVEAPTALLHPLAVARGVWCRAVGLGLSEMTFSTDVPVPCGEDQRCQRLSVHSESLSGRAGSWMHSSFHALLSGCVVIDSVRSSFVSTCLNIFLSKLLPCSAFELAVQLPVFNSLLLLFLIFQKFVFCSLIVLLSVIGCFCMAFLSISTNVSVKWNWFPGNGRVLFTQDAQTYTFKNHVLLKIITYGNLFLLYFKHLGFRFTRSLQWDLCNCRYKLMEWLCEKIQATASKLPCSAVMGVSYYKC